MNQHNFYKPDGTLFMSFDAGEPLMYTLHPSASARASGCNRELLTIHTDGRITVSEDAQPTETAKLVLEAMQGMVQEMLRREYQRGYDDATEFQEGG